MFSNSIVMSNVIYKLLTQLMSTRNQENNRRTRHLDTYLDHKIDYFDNNKNSLTTPIVSLNT